jgi:hypothetical protein
MEMDAEKLKQVEDLGNLLSLMLNEFFYETGINVETARFKRLDKDSSDYDILIRLDLRKD